MKTLDDLTSLVRSQRRLLDKRAGEARAVLTRGKEIQGEIEELAEAIQNLERVTALLNSLGEDRQLKAQHVIEELVTRGLQTIFDETLSFHIVQTTRARAASVEFLVRDTLPDQPVKDTSVIDARGGGLAATVGFLLRVVVMLLQKGTTQENLLVLDETFAHVSDEYIPALREFLREIVDKTGVQIIMVTHQSEFEEAADKVYRFSMVNGKTVVTEAAS